MTLNDNAYDRQIKTKAQYNNELLSSLTNIF